ncbi:S1C family serine protease [Leptonema illini]|jgi:serine protease Do|uniref:Peptidase S1 and S6 chymotrypsin/Hap n=1 Tax=Leptonema illini DSM 21528 TaxID=929563 RepID=H2CC59_9LEPT|nr:trypsin-like peptidase domain-containing protein [Leptonema illini]EHQ05288.1 peptidase S1 and S6 chymotrypsin/Hap [Leptonema illini DSM 21528]
MKVISLPFRSGAARRLSYGLLTFLLAAGSLQAAPFLSNRKSPLKEDASQTQVHVVQERFRRIYDLYRYSVVFIKTDLLEKNENRSVPAGLGSGFILSEEGFLCTNAHVVMGASSVEVIIDRRAYPAKVIGVDAMTDLALLKVDPTVPLKEKKFVPIYPGDSDSVRVGDFALALGNPFGLDRSFTLGIVSSVSRSELDHPGNNHIQTDAAIHPGNSGGPLINLDGEVIGMNRMIVSDGGGGIGFAIPMNDVLRVVEELRLHGKVRRGFLGVQIEEEGTLVTGVIDGGPAAKVGIRTGDRIVRVDGQTVKNYRELIRIVGPKPAGARIVIELLRDGKPLKLSVTLGERP